MATHPQTATVTLNDYLAGEEVAEFRSEFIDGAVVAMVGGTLEHGVIVGNLHGMLYARLEGGPCRVVSQGTQVKAAQGERVFYPDVAVFCGPPRREKRVRDLLLNPALLIEVLSPSTAGYDHDVKWESYRRIASLQDYLLVSQDKPRVERYTRQGDGFWLFSEVEGVEGEIGLESLNVTLPLSRIYDGVFPADEETGPESAGD
jgi:Uma2 family endonuclease